jgi:hypothetical protein
MTKVSIFGFLMAEIALMGLVGVAQAQTSTQAPPGGVPPQVHLTVGFPGDVHIDLMPPVKNGGQVTIAAHLSLKNDSKTDTTLKASNDCETHTWTVTDKGGKVLDGHTICPMIFKPVSHPLPAGANFDQDEDVTLNGKVYADGGAYVLHYRFWGVSGDAHFTTSITH